MEMNVPAFHILMKGQRSSSVTVPPTGSASQGVSLAFPDVMGRHSPAPRDFLIDRKTRPLPQGPPGLMGRQGPAARDSLSAAGREAPVLPHWSALPQEYQPCLEDPQVLLVMGETHFFTPSHCDSTQLWHILTQLLMVAG